MQNAVAFANNEVIMVAWSYGKKPDGCMGFAVYRIDQHGRETPLPGQARFKGITPKKWTTEELPIQKFYWKDPYARLEAEKNKNRIFRYKIVPLEGAPGKLQPMAKLPILLTNEVEITPVIDDKLSVYFNRGLISTQRVARALGSKDMKDSLIEKVSDPGDKSKLRESLSGDMIEAIQEFLARADGKGKIYAALYELKDPQLIGWLAGLGERLHIVLGDSKEDEEVLGEDGKPVKVTNPKTGKTKIKTVKVDGNEQARETLTGTAAEIHNRIMPNGHIAHNKFLVYVDSKGKPKAVFTGSTNWTATGLCTQTNNSIVIDNDALAKRYLAYWKELAKDTDEAADDPKALQGAALRKWASKGSALTLDDGAAAHSWFSPNTPKARGKNPATEKRPPDMEDLAQLIAGASHSVLFLAFYPGSPSIANWTAQAASKNKKLFVRGCVTNKSASEGFYYELKGMTPPARKKGEKKPPVLQDPRVFGAEAFDFKVPDGWKKEILNAGFAIIHDKVVVIDPFDDDCVVATGSHNLGHKASFDNDENLLIVRGNKKLAMAYATRILDVYDHFSSRFWFKQLGGQKDALELKSTPEEWLGKYYDKKGRLKNPQLKFWMDAAVQ
ncbi:PLD-like domain-containing protein [Variovorax sp. YR266]|uniref:phospholipase D-like domain-containing protein n=1 Tax=Variovorax sp. YR266 TaxID=1884386 RepID=UPI00089C2715|nr:phospholipase D-like domain-containing protein [Variovorax sp. YR266]SDY25331.1 PLD-like domain-containing protein [Variovorax sp. YR266]